MKYFGRGSLGALGVFSLLILGIGAVHLQAQPLLYAQDTPDGPAYIDGQLLVQFKATASDPQLSDAFKRGKLKLQRHLQTRAMNHSGQQGLTITWTDLPMKVALPLLKAHPAVAFAEPNWVYTHQETVLDDPYFLAGDLWGMCGESCPPVNAYGSHAADAWNMGHVGNSEVCVGVIDEGIDISHPDLQANIWTNPGEIPGDGIDNDGNGCIDDLNGWNFVDDTPDVHSDGADQHGTHVAGTIGAVGGNGLGVVGVNWNIRIISAKFLAPNGGTVANAVEAIDYCTDLKRRGINIVALNNSWGGRGFSQAIMDAIARAAQEGILFVAAAGNGDADGKAMDTDVIPYFPACCDTTGATGYDSVIAVTAIGETGNKPDWANSGEKNIDLGAPGVGINSTLPDAAYGAASGTSMAAPHVTGALALYASVNPGKSARDIKRILLNSAIPTASLSGITVTGGRLDAANMLSTSGSIDPPMQLKAEAISRSRIALLWTDVSSNEEEFQIERATDHKQFRQISTVGKGVTSFIDADLSRGKTYFYRVRARAGNVDSPYSNIASASTRQRPKF